MKLLFLSLLLCSCFAAQSQHLALYNADGKDYYIVGECVPGSTAAFYSSVHGGARLATWPVGEGGTITIPGSKGFKPQMILNGGVGGSRRVAYAEQREFAVTSPSVDVNGATAIVSWTGAAADDAGISFQVLRSEDGVSYHPVDNVSAQPSGDVLKRYEYTEPHAGTTVYYKIAVSSASRGARYISAPVTAAGTSGIAVFPTVTDNTITITLPAVADGACYSIVSSDGKKCGAGKLSAMQSGISMAHLAAGTYVMSVRSGELQKTVRLTKR